MLSFFRRANASWFVLGLLGLVMIAFVITGVGTPGGLEQLAAGGDRIAKVGRESVFANDIAQRMQNQLDAARQQNPQLDMVAFVRSGGLETTIDQTIAAKTLEAFALDQGMAVSRRSVDAKIAAIPSFAGPTGAFDRDTFLRVLADRKLSEAQIRNDFSTDILTQRMLPPISGVARMPMGVVRPYASLLLEGRIGSVAVVPNELVKSVTPPTDAELSTFYTRNSLRYTVPETRVIRYALFNESRLGEKAVPTEAEIADYYKKNAATYGATETRALTQVIAPDQKAAETIAAKVQGGTPLAKAASDAGLTPAKIAPKDKAGLARLASDAVAANVFSTAQGKIAAPAKSGLGWHVVQIDAITTTASRPLESARSEITAKLASAKRAEAMADLITKLEDSVAEGATFDEVAKANGFQIATMPAVTSGGIAPAQPGFKAESALQPVLADAFKGEVNEDPVVLALGEGKDHVFYTLDKINDAAPKPLSAIKAQVTQDFIAERSAKAARKIAEQVVAKANGKASLDQALAASPVRLPPSRPLAARRLDIAQAQGRVPAALGVLFSLAPGKAKLVEAEGKNGWYIVKLDRIDRGDASQRPDLIAATQGEMTQVLAEEYIGQFINAAKAHVGFTRNDESVSRLRKALVGSGGQ